MLRAIALMLLGIFGVSFVMYLIAELVYVIFSKADKNKEE